MTLHIQFTVDGPPIGKGRPRAFRSGQGVRMFTPAKTMDYETDVGFAALQQMGDVLAIDTPVSVSVVAYYPIPASWSKKRQQAALDGLEIPGKPDLDNIAKCVLDAMNQVVYVDDRQVVSLKVSKCFDRHPRLCVSVKEIVP